MATMIALVGDQPLPNVLPVRHYHPSNVLLAYTEKTRQKYEYQQATLQRDCHVYGLETDPYDIPAIVRALNAKLDEQEALASQPLAFNLTGGTKTMSLAAYQVAQQRGASMIYIQSEGKRTRVYHYAWEQQQLKATGSELLPECITLRDVFDLYFGPNNWEDHGPSSGTGGAFENTLAAMLRRHGYEVMIGVKAMKNQIDVDVAVRLGNQYGIIEAKMGENGKKFDGIKQLSTAARLLGTYSQTFYAITVLPTSDHKMITEASNIQVISLSGYNATTNRLSATDEAVLLASIEKALKG